MALDTPSESGYTASIVLSPQEIADLTNKKRPSAQVKELTVMRIPFKRRRDGSLAVMRIHTHHGTPAKEQHASPKVSL